MILAAAEPAAFEIMADEEEDSPMMMALHSPRMLRLAPDDGLSWSR
jgi:hypothetical protein